MLHLNVSENSLNNEWFLIKEEIFLSFSNKLQHCFVLINSLFSKKNKWSCLDVQFLK